MTRKMDRLRYYQLIQHIKQSRPLENTRDYLLAKMCELKADGELAQGSTDLYKVFYPPR